jgi:hypothetical protein
MDPGLAAVLAVPRTVEFRTDAEGLRNAADYQEQALVLVGDSFIVGNGTTQAQTLPEQLRREHGLDAYSIAFPSDTREYFESSRRFLGRHPGARFMFFYFEGNDFESPLASRSRAQKPASYDRFRNRVRKRLYPSLQYPIVLFGVSRRLEQQWSVRQGARPSPVVAHEIGRRAVGFFDEYIVAARSSDLRFPAEYAAPEVVARTSCVFFIPTKYRVYKAWIADGAALPEPPPALTALQSFYASRGVEVLDLTPALRWRAAEMLARDEMVFWPDDTHWNQHGMRAAAAVVAGCAENDG